MRVEKERLMLCCLMKNDDKVSDMIKTVKEVYFSDAKNKLLFKTIEKIFRKDKSTSSALIKSELGSSFNEFIDDICGEMYSNSNWLFYARKLKEYHEKDVYFNSFEKNKPQTEEHAKEAMKKTIEEYSNVLMNNEEARVIDIKNLCLSTVKEISDAFENKSKIKTKTGIKAIDKILRNVKNEYIILGARPSIGKSALAVSIAMNIARQNIKVLYLSLEMRAEQIAIRRISEIAGIPIQNIVDGFLDGKEMSKVNMAIDNMANHDFFVIDKMNATLENVLTQIRKSYAVDGVRAFFIDHVSLIRTDASKKARHECFIEISNSLQRIQRELDIILFVVMQVGRDNEGKAPNLASLKESSAFEQDCDVAMLLHRERVENPNTESIEAEIRIVKNRNGACGVEKLFFQPKYSRFIDRGDNGL